MRFLAVLLAACAFSGCGESATPGAITRRFEDRFERSSVGADYRNTGGPYAIVNGELHVKGARNHPLWLRRRLPRDAAIEFDVRSETPDGDIKVELYGDGQSTALSPEPPELSGAGGSTGSGASTGCSGSWQKLKGASVPVFFGARADRCAGAV